MEQTLTDLATLHFKYSHHYRAQGKVMFSQASVNLFRGGMMSFHISGPMVRQGGGGIVRPMVHPKVVRSRLSVNQ